MTTTYVTVAIPYVNADPHLGYAFELVEADVFARAARACGERVRFLGGTDDHSLKNVLAAAAAGVPTRAFVDARAARFADLAGPLGLSFDDFIRTSADPRHRPAVERLWRACAGRPLRRRLPRALLRRVRGVPRPGRSRRRPLPRARHGARAVAERNWFFRLSRVRASDCWS